MNVRFPVFVREKDSGDVFKSGSMRELQQNVERIDIENSEYDAWDAEGRPLRLGVQEPVWLTLESAGQPVIPALRSAIAVFAAKRGVVLSENQQSVDDLAMVLNQLPSVRQRRT